MLENMSSRNQTITITTDEAVNLSKQLYVLPSKDKIITKQDITNQLTCQNMLETAKYLPNQFVDLLFLDPPYNIAKDFAGSKFKRTSLDDYRQLLDTWINSILHTLKPTASIYICNDWQMSGVVYDVCSKYFHIRNRITWEREKGRGAKHNWKNCSEDIWFCTMSNDYYFDCEAVKLKRKVIAPYRHDDGSAKDWSEGDNGNYRLTSPSNLWTDISVPFWSMPENTCHPTQKPEKLLAKIILASSKQGDFILDPFLGSGTTAVVAKKLGRNFLGIEQEREYCYYALKRLRMADTNNNIQGYSDGVFWERNTLSQQKKRAKPEHTHLTQDLLS